MKDPASATAPLQIQRILFPLDVSERSAAALPYAAAFARRFNAEVLVFHPVGREAESASSAEPARIRGNIRERMEHLLAAVHFPDVRFRVLLEQGETVDAIPAAVRREGVDLIVAGSEGRHGLQKLFDPPVDQAIAGAAPCPVLLIGPEVVVPAEQELRIQRVLHPITFHPHSRPTLERVYALAQTYAASLYLLHVTDNAFSEPLATRVPAETFCRAQLLENGLPDNWRGVEPQFLVEFGPPENLILETARRLSVQLIAMGVAQEEHPTLLSHLPGPLVYDIASHAPCPVLAVHQSGSLS